MNVLGKKPKYWYALSFFPWCLFLLSLSQCHYNKEFDITLFHTLNIVTELYSGWWPYVAPEGSYKLQSQKEHCSWDLRDCTMNKVLLLHVAHPDSIPMNPNELRISSGMIPEHGPGVIPEYCWMWHPPPKSTSLSSLSLHKFGAGGGRMIENNRKVQS